MTPTEREMTTDEQLEQALIYIDSLHEIIENIKVDDKARNQAEEAKTVIELLTPLAENGMTPELKHTHSYIIERAKKFLLKTKP